MSPQPSNRTPHDRRPASNLWVPILTHHLHGALTARSGQFNGSPCRSAPQGCVSTPRIASWGPASRVPDELRAPAARELDRVPIEQRWSIPTVPRVHGLGTELSSLGIALGRLCTR